MISLKPQLPQEHLSRATTATTSTRNPARTSFELTTSAAISTSSSAAASSSSSPSSFTDVTRAALNFRRQDYFERSFSLPSVLLRSPRSHAATSSSRRNANCWKILRYLGLLFILVVAPTHFMVSFLHYHSVIPQTIHKFSSSSSPSTTTIEHDYTSIQSIEDLEAVWNPHANLQPQCFEGVVDCPCNDPLAPVNGGLASRSWKEKQLHNHQRTQSEEAIGVDLVFYGDSIMERWAESQIGTPKAPGSRQVFNKLFRKTYKAIALGISGDTSPMLLWRLQKGGELPANLNPSVFWILIGTNDIGRTWCSAEMIVLGILRNVEEILKRKPKAQIVLQGLLPRSYHKDGWVKLGNGVKPSVWAEIRVINAELKAYATFRDRVSYFETDLFFRDDSPLQIDKSLMSDYLHPTVQGYELWGREILDFLDSMKLDKE